MNEMAKDRTGTFIGTKERGKPKIFDLAGFNAVLAQYGDGEDFYLHIEEPGRKRTRAQEKFFHGPVLKAFMSEGRGKQEAKDMLCLMFIPREIVMLDGSSVRVPGSTSALNVEDYNDLIEQSIQLAAENGVIVIDGGEWRARQAHEARTARKAS